MKRGYLWLLLISCFLLILDLQVGIFWPKQTVQNLFRPVNLGLYSIGGSIAEKVEFVGALPLIHEENRRLKEEISRLKYLVLENEFLKRETEALKEQMQILGTHQEKFVEARVLGESQFGDQNVFQIDKGSGENIKVGQVAVLGKRLIGRVIKVEPHVSFILPIFANTSRVPVLVGEEEKVRGLIVGRFNTQLVLTQVLPEENIKKGDLIISSGEAGLYPSHFLVGEVAEVEKSDSSLYIQATVIPFWNKIDLEVIFIKE